MAATTLCLVFSGLQPSLGLREAESVLGRPVERLSDRIGLVEAEPGEVQPLLAKLYECVLVQEVIAAKAWRLNPPPHPEFYRELAAMADWSELRGRSFAVTVRKLGGYPPAKSTDLAAAVADAVLGSCSARVDLEEPEVRVRLVVSRAVAVVGVLLLRPRGDRLRLRSKRYKVYKHPASLTPEDAKLLLNLSGCRGTVVDPFCGSGSIVVEACLSGLEAVGLDIDPRAASGALRNLVHFSCDARGHVVVGDACIPPFRRGAFSGVVTNPPYGRSAQLQSSSGSEVHECLMRVVLDTVKERGSIAYIVPSNPMAAGELSLRVHGGLARTFVVEAKG